MQVVVFPFPCSPTNMTTFGRFFFGRKGSPPSSMPQSSRKTARSINRRVLCPAASSSLTDFFTLFRRRATIFTLTSAWSSAVQT